MADQDNWWAVHGEALTKRWESNAAQAQQSTDTSPTMPDIQTRRRSGSTSRKASSAKQNRADDNNNDWQCDGGTGGSGHATDHSRSLGSAMGGGGSSHSWQASSAQTWEEPDNSNSSWGTKGATSWQKNDEPPRKKQTTSTMSWREKSDRPNWDRSEVPAQKRDPVTLKERYSESGSQYGDRHTRGSERDGGSLGSAMSQADSSTADHTHSHRSSGYGSEPRHHASKWERNQSSWDSHNRERSRDSHKPPAIPQTRTVALVDADSAKEPRRHRENTQWDNRARSSNYERDRDRNDRWKESSSGYNQRDNRADQSKGKGKKRSYDWSDQNPKQARRLAQQADEQQRAAKTIDYRADKQMADGLQDKVDEIAWGIQLENDAASSSEGWRCSQGGKHAAWQQEEERVKMVKESNRVREEQLKENQQMHALKKQKLGANLTPDLQEPGQTAMEVNARGDGVSLDQAVMEFGLRDALNMSNNKLRHKTLGQLFGMTAGHDDTTEAHATEIIQKSETHEAIPLWCKQNDAWLETRHTALDAWEGNTLRNAGIRLRYIQIPKIHSAREGTSRQHILVVTVSQIIKGCPMIKEEDIVNDNGEDWSNGRKTYTKDEIETIKNATGIDINSDYTTTVWPVTQINDFRVLIHFLTGAKKPRRQMAQLVLSSIRHAIDSQSLADVNDQITFAAEKKGPYECKPRVHFHFAFQIMQFITLKVWGRGDLAETVAKCLLKLKPNNILPTANREKYSSANPFVGRHTGRQPDGSQAILDEFCALDGDATWLRSQVGNRHLCTCDRFYKTIEEASNHRLYLEAGTNLNEAAASFENRCKRLEIDMTQMNKPNKPFNLHQMVMYLFPLLDKLAHCDVFLISTADKDAENKGWEWCAVTLRNILIRTSNIIHNIHPVDDGEGNYRLDEETVAFIHIDLRHCKGWNHEEHPPQWSQVTWAMAAWTALAEKKHVFGFDIDMAMTGLVNPVHFTNRLIAPVRSMRGMNGPVAALTVSEPVAPCNAGMYAFMPSTTHEQNVSPLRGINADNAYEKLKAWIEQILTDQAEVVGLIDDYLTKQRRQYDMNAWSRVPVNQAPPRNAREAIQRLLVIAIVYGIRLFPKLRPNYRQAFPVDLPEDLRSELQAAGLLDWACAGSDQPANATLRVSSNPMARTFTLPSSIIMTPFAPLFFQLRIDGTSYHIPKVMLTWVHHAFGEKRKNTLHIHREKWIYPDQHELLAGADTYCTAYKCTLDKRLKERARGLDNNFAIAHANDSEFDEQVRIWTCEQCGCQQWDMALLIQRTPYCPRCQQVTTITPEKEAYLLDPLRVNQVLAPILERNGVLIPSSYMLTTRLPLPPRMKYHYSSFHLERQMEVLRTTAPGMHQCLDAEELKEAATIQKWSITRSIPIHKLPKPVHRSDLTAWSPAMLQAAREGYGKHCSVSDSFMDPSYTDYICCQDWVEACTPRTSERPSEKTRVTDRTWPDTDMSDTIPFLPWCRFAASATVRQLPAPGITDGLDRYKPGDYVATAKEIAEILDREWREQLEWDQREREVMPHPSVPEGVKLECLKAPILFSGTGAGTGHLDRKATRIKRNNTQVIGMVCAGTDTKHKRRSHSKFVSRGVMGTSMRIQEDTVNGISQVTPGYFTQDRINDKITSDGSYRTPEVAKDVIEAFLGDREADVRYLLRPILEQETLVPSWMTDHDPLAIIIVSQFLNSTSGTLVDIMGSSAGVSAACLVATLINRRKQNRDETVQDTTMTRTLPAVASLICLGGAIPPVLAKDVYDLSIKAHITWFTSDTDRVAPTGDVMGSIIKMYQKADQRSPTIRNFRIEGQAEIMSEIFGRQGHGFHGPWQALTASAYDYTPLPVGTLETDGTTPLNIEKLRRHIPFAAYQLKHRAFLFDLVADTVCNHLFEVDKLKAAAALKQIDEMRTNCTYVFEALLLTANHGWDTLTQYLVNLPSHQALGKNNMFDPAKIAKTMEEHHITDLSPFCLFHLMIYQVSTMIDSLQNPENGRGKGKDRNWKPGASTSDQADQRSAIMTERGDLICSANPGAAAIQIPQFTTYNAKWLIVRLEFEQKEQALMAEDPAYINPAPRRSDPNTDLTTGGGFAVWRQPRRTWEKPELGVHEGDYLSFRLQWDKIEKSGAEAANDMQVESRDAPLNADNGSLGTGIGGGRGTRLDKQGKVDLELAGWVIDYDTEYRRMGGKGNDLDKTIVYNVQIMAKLHQDAIDKTTQASNARPEITIKSIHKGSGSTFLANMEKIMAISDLEHLAVAGALLNIKDVWKEKGLMDDPNVEKLLATASSPDAAKRHAKLMVTAAQEIMTSAPGKAKLIAELAILAETVNPARVGHKTRETVQHRIDTLVHDISAKSVVLTAGLTLVGPKAMLALLAEVLGLKSVLNCELVTNGVQKAMHSWVERRFGPPGSGKSTLINILTILKEAGWRNAENKEGKTIAMCTQNSAVRELANGLARMVDEDSTAKGNWGRMVATSQIHKNEHTPLDMNPRLLKKGDVFYATAGSVRVDLTRKFPILPYKSITYGILEECQMLDGVDTYHETAPQICEILRANGGQLLITGDPKQHKGGRETENARRMTRHANFSRAGGRGSHSTTATPAACVTKAECIMFAVGLGDDMIADLPRAKELVGNIVDAVLVFEATANGYIRGNACKNLCSKCDTCHQAVADIDLLLRLAGQASSIRQMGFGSDATRNKATLEAATEAVKETYTAMMERKVEMQPPDTPAAEVRWPQQDEIPAPPPDPLQQAIRVFVAMHNIANMTAADHPFHYTELQAMAQDSRFMPDIVLPSDTARRMDPFTHTLMFATDYVHARNTATHDLYAPHPSTGLVRTTRYRGQGRPALDLSGRIAASITKRANNSLKAILLPPVTRLVFYNVIRKTNDFPNHHDRVTYNREYATDVVTLLANFIMSHYPHILDAHQPLTIITATHATRSRLREALTLDNGMQTTTGLEPSATALDRMDDTTSTLTPEDREMVFSALMKQGYGYGHPKEACDVILSSDAVGTSHNITIHVINNESGIQRSEPGDTVNTSRARALHYTVEGLTTPSRLGPSARRAMALDLLGLTIPIPPADKLADAMVLSPVLGLQTHDLVYNRNEDLHPHAQAIAASIDPTVKYILPYQSECADPNDPESLKYVLGIQRPNCVPENPEAFPVPAGTLMIALSQEFRKAHVGTPNGFYVVKSSSCHNGLEGGMLDYSSGTPTTYCLAFHQLCFISAPAGAGLLAMDQRHKLSFYPQVINERTGQWVLRGRVRNRQRSAEPLQRVHDWIHIFWENHMQDHRDNGRPRTIHIFQGPRDARPGSTKLTVIGSAHVMAPRDDEAKWFHPLIDSEMGPFAHRTRHSLRIFAGLDIATSNLPFITKNDIESRPKGASGAKHDEGNTRGMQYQVPSVITYEDYEMERTRTVIEEELHDDCDAVDLEAGYEPEEVAAYDPITTERVVAGLTSLWEGENDNLKAPHKTLTNMARALANTHCVAATPEIVLDVELIAALIRIVLMTSIGLFYSPVEIMQYEATSVKMEPIEGDRLGGLDGAAQTYVDCLAAAVGVSIPFLSQTAVKLVTSRREQKGNKRRFTTPMLGKNKYGVVCKFFRKRPYTDFHSSKAISNGIHLAFKHADHYLSEDAFKQAYAAGPHKDQRTPEILQKPEHLVKLHFCRKDKYRRPLAWDTRRFTPAPRLAQANCKFNDLHRPAWGRRKARLDFCSDTRIEPTAAPVLPGHMVMQVPMGTLASAIIVITREGAPPWGAGSGDKIFTISRKALTDDVETNEVAIGSAMKEVFGANNGQKEEHSKDQEHTIRCAQCETILGKTDSLTEMAILYHFCNDECRGQFEQVNGPVEAEKVASNVTRGTANTDRLPDNGSLGPGIGAAGRYSGSAEPRWIGYVRPEIEQEETAITCDEADYSVELNEIEEPVTDLDADMDEDESTQNRVDGLLSEFIAPLSITDEAGKGQDNQTRQSAGSQQPADVTPTQNAENMDGVVTDRNAAEKNHPGQDATRSDVEDEPKMADTNMSADLNSVASNNTDSFFTHTTGDTVPTANADTTATAHQEAPASHDTTGLDEVKKITRTGQTSNTAVKLNTLSTRILIPTAMLRQEPAIAQLLTYLANITIELRQKYGPAPAALGAFDTQKDYCSHDLRVRRTGPKPGPFPAADEKPLTTRERELEFAFQCIHKVRRLVSDTSCRFYQSIGMALHLPESGAAHGTDDSTETGSQTERGNSSSYALMEALLIDAMSATSNFQVAAVNNTCDIGIQRSEWIEAAAAESTLYELRMQCTEECRNKTANPTPRKARAFVDSTKLFTVARPCAPCICGSLTVNRYSKAADTKAKEEVQQYRKTYKDKYILDPFAWSTEGRLTDVCKNETFSNDQVDPSSVDLECTDGLSTSIFDANGKEVKAKRRIDQWDDGAAEDPLRIIHDFQGVTEANRPDLFQDWPDRGICDWEDVTNKDPGHIKAADPRGNEGEDALLAYIRNKRQDCRRILESGRSPYFVSQGWSQANEEGVRWGRQRRYLDREYLKMSNPAVPNTGRWRDRGLPSDEERVQPDELVNSDSEASDHMEPLAPAGAKAKEARRGDDNHEKRAEYIEAHRNHEQNARKDKKKAGKMGFFKAAAAGSNEGGDWDYVFLNDPERGNEYPKRANFGTCRANLFAATSSVTCNKEHDSMVSTQPLYWTSEVEAANIWQGKIATKPRRFPSPSHVPLMGGKLPVDVHDRTFPVHNLSELTLPEYKNARPKDDMEENVVRAEMLARQRTVVAKATTGTGTGNAFKAEGRMAELVEGMQKLCIKLATDPLLVKNLSPSTRRWRDLSVRLTARKDVRRKTKPDTDAVELLFCENCDYNFHTEQAFEENVTCPACGMIRQARPCGTDDAANDTRGGEQTAASSSGR